MSVENQTAKENIIPGHRDSSRNPHWRKSSVGSVKIYAGILFCITLLVAPALAGSQLVAPSASINGEVYLPITISGVTSSPGVSLVISYNPTQLQVLDVVRNTSISGTAVSAKNINATTGTINVLIVNTASSITADTPLGLADLRLRPLQNGTSTITIKTAEWSDAGFMPKTFDSLIAGTIVVGTPLVTSATTVSATTAASATTVVSATTAPQSLYYYEDIPTTVAPEFISPTGIVTSQTTAKPEVSKTEQRGTSIQPPTTSAPGQDIIHESPAATAVSTVIPTTTPTQKAPGFTALTFAVLCIGGAVITLTARKR